MNKLRCTLLLTASIMGFLSADSCATAKRQAGAGPLQARARPLNVLLITADDLGLQPSSYGNTAIRTPSIDKLAASGVQFDIAYVAQASCSSSRAAMFTGLFVHSNGQYGLTNASDFSLHPHLHSATIPNILKRAGYRTGIIGKLHVAPEESFQFDKDGLEGVSMFDVSHRDVRRFAQFADEFITEAGDKPFFLMMNYADPHAYDPAASQGSWNPTFLDQMKGIPEKLVEPSEKTILPFQQIDTSEQRKRVAGYYNEVLRLDVGIGMVMDVLERRRHTDDTLVIFIGDNGPPFDRGKATAYEAGLRVPFIVRWPGVSKPMRSRAMVSTVDILPTIIDAARAEPAVEMHGRSLRPVVSAANVPWREYLVGEFHMHGRPFFPRRGIRDQRYKLIHNLLAGKVTPSRRIDGDLGYRLSQEVQYKNTDVGRAFDTFANPPAFELYDLENDPWEFHNLAGQAKHKEVQERMTRALLKWRKETNDPFLDPGFLEKLATQVNKTGSSPKSVNLPEGLGIQGHRGS